MTTLNFPNLEDFFLYLKQHNIHRYGLCSVCETSPASQGAAFYSESFRFTSIDDKRKELLKCDVLYYRSIFVTEEHNRKKAKKPKEKVLEALQKEIEEWTKGFELKLLHCQFEA